MKTQKRMRLTLGLIGLLLTGCVAAPPQPPTITHAPASAKKSPTPKTSASETPSVSPTPTPTPTGPVAIPVDARSVSFSPLTRFHILYDFDGFHTYAPGAIIPGPLHINRGPGGNDPTDALLGRSVMNIVSDHLGYVTPPGGSPYTIFHGPVSLSMKPDVDRPLSLASIFNVDSFFGLWPRQAAPRGVPLDATVMGGIFTHSDNATGLGDRPGPTFITAEAPLPGPLAERLGPALGLPAGTPPTDRAWFRALPDGLYIPTAAMAAGTGEKYEAGTHVAGGLYVRGNVRTMRATVKGDLSYYVIVVGDLTGQHQRLYGVQANRRTQTLTLVAAPPRSYGSGLKRMLAEFDVLEPDMLFQKETTQPVNLTDWGIEGPSLWQKMSFTGLPDGSAPFNGVIVIDYAAGDPLRDPTSGVIRPATKTLRPHSGHLLALGAPEYADKHSLGGDTATFPLGLRNAEAFSTEPAAGTAVPTGLSIMAAGYVFIQNHLVVTGLLRAAGTPDTAEAFMTALETAPPTAAATRDRLCVWSDRRVLIGQTAPSVPREDEVGTLITASLIGLESPSRTEALLGATPQEAYQGMRAYIGSVSTEALGWYYNFTENLEIGDEAGKGTWGKFEANPIYQADADMPANSLALINQSVRGRQVIFGSIIAAQRSPFITGNKNFVWHPLYDARLAELPPPLVP